MVLDLGVELGQNRVDIVSIAGLDRALERWTFCSDMAYALAGDPLGLGLERRRAYLDATSYSWWSDGGVDLSLGRFADEQPYLGCRRARCGLCHLDKRWHPGADRLAAERAWRRDWAEELP